MERCVFVVDDNPILSHTHKAWAEQGYSQRCAKYGEEAVNELVIARKSGNDVRLIALVADYLGERLIPMIKLMRRVTTLPMLILTTEYHEKIRAEAFVLGADRYLPIPATIDEGIISGLALIRLSERAAGMDWDSNALILPNGFYISAEQRRVLLKEREVRLTHKEFDLLWYFALNKNLTLRYEQIYAQVWGGEYREADDHTIWSTVNRLRNKLQSGFDPQFSIRNERYIGYRFEI